MTTPNAPDVPGTPDDAAGMVGRRDSSTALPSSSHDGSRPAPPRELPPADGPVSEVAGATALGGARAEERTAPEAAAGGAVVGGARAGGTDGVGQARAEEAGTVGGVGGAPVGRTLDEELLRTLMRDAV
ncbi:MAG TPA: hypothetical protein VIW71_18120, partial [Streptomyces sp.]